MEFLKELFNGGALTYDQLAEAAKGKGLTVVDASAYVPKTDADNLQQQINTLTGQLSAANSKLEGYDPEWKDKAEAERKKLEAQTFDFALEKALAGAKARDAIAVKAHLDRDKLTLLEGEILGLDKQLETLRKDDKTSFLFEQETPMRTGMSHQGGTEGTPDKKEEANEALRALFGKEL